MGSGSTELGAASPRGEMSTTLCTTISYHPGGAASIPKMEPVPTCCFLLSAAGPLVTPMRWSMTCMRCSKELDNSPSLFSRCLFCRRDTTLPGTWTHHSTYGTHTPACGAPTFPTLCCQEMVTRTRPSGDIPSHHSSVPTPPGNPTDTHGWEQHPPGELSSGGSLVTVTVLTLSCLTPSASSSSPDSKMSDWDLPSREYLGRILRAESGVWQCSGSAWGSAESPPSSDLLRGFPDSPALLGARKMSLSIERLLLGAVGPPSGSFSHLEPRLDLGFLKAKKFPIFFLRVREPEGARGADPRQVSGVVGLRRNEALEKVSSRLPRGKGSVFFSLPALKRWIQTLDTPPEIAVFWQGHPFPAWFPWVLPHCLPLWNRLHILHTMAAISFLFPQPCPWQYPWVSCFTQHPFCTGTSSETLGMGVCWAGEGP